MTARLFFSLFLFLSYSFFGNILLKPQILILYLRRKESFSSEGDGEWIRSAIVLKDMLAVSLVSIGCSNRGFLIYCTGLKLSV